jgi:membrane-associated phospholipid phosphatase
MMTDRARLVRTVLPSVILQLALLTAVMIGLGFLLTHVLVHVWPLTIEDRAVNALLADRSPARNRESNLISLTAYTTGIVTTLVGAGGLMRVAYHRWRESLFLAAAVVCQLVVFKLTALTVARPRPAVAQLDRFPPNQSFPSGHVAAALALYGGIAVVLALHARRRAHAAVWWAVLLIVPIAVGVSRVYRGMHHPSDVFASFLVGLGCLWILRRAMFTPAERRGAFQL